MPCSQDDIVELRLAPRQCLLVTGEHRRSAFGFEWTERCAGAPWHQCPVRRTGGVEIPAEQLRFRLAPTGGGVTGDRQFGGIYAQQIMQAIAAGKLLGDQASRPKLGQVPSGLSLAYPGHTPSTRHPR